MNILNIAHNILQAIVSFSPTISSIFYSSHSVVHFGQDGLDLVLGELSEPWLSIGCKADLNIVGLEVSGAHGLEHLDSALDSFFLAPLATFFTSFLEVFLELGHGFLVFVTCGHGSEADVLAGGVHTVALGTKLQIAANQGDNDAEGTHAGVLTELLQVS